MDIIKAAVFIFLAGSLLGAVPPGHAKDQTLPFARGEEIEYRVSWEMVKAGTARFKVLPATTVNGESAFHFRLDVKSSRYIDMIYKIRDTLEGFTDEAFEKSLLYRKTQSGRDKKEIIVTFDWDAQTATYSNFGGKRDPIKIPANTFDPLSSFYKLRTLDLDAAKSLSFPVTDGKKQFVQAGSVIKKERLTLPAGSFDTYLLVPSVNHFSGVFKKSDNPTVHVWVTADSRKIPVRIKVKVFFGSLYFDLVSVQSPNSR